MKITLLSYLSVVYCSIYGHTSTRYLRAGWIVVKVDFTDILRKRCNLTTDYYKWSPTSGVSVIECLTVHDAVKCQRF